MVSRLVMAVVVGIITTLVCVLLGSIFMMFDINWAAAIGSFLKSFSGLLGLLAALWHFFSGTTWPNLKV